MRLGNRIALVTGASSGIGAAIACGFAHEGADVVVNYNANREGALETARCVEHAGQAAMVVCADVSDPAAVGVMLEQVRERFGRLDILVNNAGITPKRPFHELDASDWDQVLDTNARGAFLCSRAALPLMRRGGSVLNISSIHASRTTHNFSIYAASKGALESLTRALAIELGDRGIRVNALRLGWIQVERDRVDPGAREYELFCARVPLGRPGEVQDVVPVAVFLSSDEAGYVTGQVWGVDGGHEAVLSTAFPKGHVDGGARA